jgi:hypothetical protein
MKQAADVFLFALGMFGGVGVAVLLCITVIHLLQPIADEIRIRIMVWLKQR